MDTTTTTTDLLNHDTAVSAGANLLILQVEDVHFLHGLGFAEDLGKVALSVGIALAARLLHQGLNRLFRKAVNSEK